MTYHIATAACNPLATYVTVLPTIPKLPANTFSSAIISRPSGAAVVGFASSSRTTGKAINVFPTRKLLKTKATVLQR